MSRSLRKGRRTGKKYKGRGRKRTQRREKKRTRRQKGGDDETPEKFKQDSHDSYTTPSGKKTPSEQGSTRSRSRDFWNSCS